MCIFHAALPHNTARCRIRNKDTYALPSRCQQRSPRYQVTISGKRTFRSDLVILRSSKGVFFDRIKVKPERVRQWCRVRKRRDGV